MVVNCDDRHHDAEYGTEQMAEIMRLLVLASSHSETIKVVRDCPTKERDGLYLTRWHEPEPLIIVSRKTTETDIYEIGDLRYTPGHVSIRDPRMRSHGDEPFRGMAGSHLRSRCCRAPPEALRPRRTRHPSYRQNVNALF